MAIPGSSKTSLLRDLNNPWHLSSRFRLHLQHCCCSASQLLSAPPFAGVPARSPCAVSPPTTVSFPIMLHRPLFSFPPSVSPSLLAFAVHCSTDALSASSSSPILRPFHSCWPLFRSSSSSCVSICSLPALFCFALCLALTLAFAASRILAAVFLFLPPLTHSPNLSLLPRRPRRTSASMRCSHALPPSSSSSTPLGLTHASPRNRTCATSPHHQRAPLALMQPCSSPPLPLRLLFCLQHCFPARSLVLESRNVKLFPYPSSKVHSRHNRCWNTV